MTAQTDNRLATQTFTAWADAFTPAELDRIEAYGDSLTPEAAVVLAETAEGEQQGKIRITQTAWMPQNDQTKWFYDKMQAVIRSLNDESYRYDLRGFSESFQYTVYRDSEGGHYDWHVDQGPLKVQRKLSVSLQLSAHDSYEGCDLQFVCGNKTETAPRGRGNVIAFPSYVLHRVTPIVSGTRKAIVVWTTGPNFGNAPMSTPQMMGSFIAWENVFSSAELDAIIAYGDDRLHEKAPLAVQSENYDAVRITKVAWIEHNRDTAAFYEKVAGVVRHLNTHFYHFDVSGLENFQYTLYHGSEGGHYDWHIDYGGRNPRPRKISISIQLSDPADYEGCELHLKAGNTIDIAPKTRGAVIAFPAFFLHRVTPVTAGTRKSLVVWAQGAAFR